MTTIHSLWRAAAGVESFDGLVQRFTDADHDDLARAAANDVLNDWLSGVADYGSHDTDRHGHGKRLPYIGWYWREVDFARKDITVGDCGDFIGFMENNKWDYPERSLTTDEADYVIERLWQARIVAHQGGVVADLNSACDEVLDALWNWMQDLTGLTRWDER